MNVLDYYSVDKNVFKLYEASNVARNISNEANRLLKAEDVSWKCRNAKTLANIALECIAANFQLFTEFFQSNSISETDRNKLMHIIPTNLPLSLSSTVIPESIYWKKACYDNWTLGFFMPQFNGSWKTLYMEKFLQSYIENTYPGNIHMIEFKEFLEMLKPYIFSLTIEQLLIISEGEECHPDDDTLHIDLKFILSSLSNLRNFSIACGVKNCEIDFCRKMYELTETDCTNIGKGLQWTIRLENYKMHRCNFNPDKVESLTASWEILTCLRVVQFMSCGLDDECLFILNEALIKLPSLEELSLANNKIGLNGAKSLASSLEYCCSLKILNLRLNFILDEGGIAIFEAASKHRCLEELILEGCELDHCAIFQNFASYWRKLTSETQLRWLGPEKGVIHLATAAIVNALWDLWARIEKKTVWKLLVDMEPEELVSVIDFRYISDVVTKEEAIDILKQNCEWKMRTRELSESEWLPCVYNSSWLGYSDDKLKNLCKKYLSMGFTGFKIKVGENAADDMRRCGIVRDVIGNENHLMIDANQRWNIPEAIDSVKLLAPYKPLWIEEPTSPDDILGHVTISNALKPFKIGVASGEMASNRVIFKQLLQSGGIQYCQIDSCRLGSINEILAVYIMAKKFDIPVCPHAGGVGLCEMVQHTQFFDFICLSTTIQNGQFIEYVDDEHDHFTTEIKISNGNYMPPEEPGYGVCFKEEIFQKYESPTGTEWSTGKSQNH